MAAGPEPLARVLANPDADKPRLDYAAWCDAQPDAPTQARGTFIRAQVNLIAKAATGTWRELHLLGHESSDARLQFGQRWDPSLTALASVVGYDRGFAEHIALSAAAWRAQGPAIRRLAPIRHLDLSRAGLGGDGAALLASDALASIRSLSLDQVGLTDEEVEALAESPHVADLRWLSMASNALTPRAGVALARSKSLPRLVYANFSGNPYNPIDEYSTEDGVVASTWPTKDGARLEAKHGPLPWLHWPGRDPARIIPDRYRV